MLTARVNYVARYAVREARRAARGPALGLRGYVGVEMTNTDNTPLASTHPKTRRTFSPWPSGNSSLWVRRKVSCDDTKLP